MLNAMWIWAALGLVLLGVEMATGTFYVLWFGISALSVAIAMWMFPNIPQAMQLAMFAALSISSLAIWKLNYKKHETHSRVGQAQGRKLAALALLLRLVAQTKTVKYALRKA